MIRKPLLALDANIVQDNVPVEIIPGVFIGSIHAAFNQEALVDCGVTHVSFAKTQFSRNIRSFALFLRLHPIVAMFPLGFVDSKRVAATVHLPEVVHIPDGGPA